MISYKQSGQQEGEDFGSQRPRSNTVSEGTKVTDSKVLPTVFKWEGGGKQVYISGTFTGWKTLPMVKSHGDFVTIIDLPEGEHQYKFFVDGEWRHDPGLVRIIFANLVTVYHFYRVSHTRHKTVDITENCGQWHGFQK